MTGDHQREVEGQTMHTNFSQMLLKDHYAATQLPQHNLIQWTDGVFPQLPAASSSSASASASTSSAPDAASAGQPHF